MSDKEYEYCQRSRRQKEKEYWTKIKQFALEDKVSDFYRLYAEYLEWNNVISPDRKAIHKMATRVVEILSQASLVALVVQI